MRTSKIQNAHQGVSGVWKVLYPYVLWRSRQLLLNKIFDLRTPSMRKGCDGERNGMENNGESIGPLTLLPVDILTATECNAAARANNMECS